MRKKASLDRLFRFPVEQVATVLLFGDAKHGSNNWLDDQAISRREMAAKILRHTAAWLRGNDADPETGQSHLAHAAADALILLEMERSGLGVDDRFPPTNPVE